MNHRAFKDLGFTEWGPDSIQVKRGAALQRNSTMKRPNPVNIDECQLEFDKMFTDKKCQCEICSPTNMKRFRKQYEKNIKEAKDRIKKGEKDLFDDFLYINKKFFATNP